MRRLVVAGVRGTICFLMAILIVPPSAAAQTEPVVEQVVVPKLIRFDGALASADGRPFTGPALLIFSIYAEQEEGVALWTEYQKVELDRGGRFAVYLGQTEPEGLPLDIFGSGEARWLGVAAAGEQERPRIMLISVPYALKAAEADRLGGRTAADFVLANKPKTEGGDAPNSEKGSGEAGRDDASVVADATVNVIPKFSSTGGAETDSALTEVGGNLGVGTPPGVAPTYRLTVTAAGHSLGQFTNTATGTGPADGAYFGVLNGDPTFRIYNFENANTEFFTNNLRRMTVAANGNVGIGSNTPNYPLQIHAAGHSLMQFTNAATGTGPTDGAYFGVLSGDPTFRLYNFENAGMEFYTNNLRRMTVSANGNVNIAQNMTVDGNIGAKYQDVAEWVQACEELSPGTIVVIEAGHRDHVRASTTAYDFTVAGAVSLQPGLILGEAGPGRVMVAQSGRVRIKVDAGFGAIHTGDLLVTSPTAGYAMRSEPVEVGGVSIHRPGTLVGKALESLEGGTGEILALLTLQ